jgi:hypothetical protein
MTDKNLTLFDLPRTNGEANKLDPLDSPVHDWYRFVLSFPPHLVRDYLNKFGLNDQSLLLDPFCGTGTTIVECKKNGIASVGIEALPIPHFASVVKTNWEIDPDELLSHARRVAQKTISDLHDQGINDDPAIGSSYSGSKLRTLSPESMRLLLKESISPLPLHKVLVLLETIRADGDRKYQDHELLALARALVSSIGNLKFGPEVGIGKIKDDAPVVEPWLANVEKMVGDLRDCGNKVSSFAEVMRGDSRELTSLLRSRRFHAVFTSPPYPNEKDYTRTTRLEMVLLGFINNLPELRALKKSLIRSNTRNVYKEDKDDAWILKHTDIHRIAHEIERRRIALGKTSGFERLYHRVTKLYFGGIAQHLSTLRSMLAPGAALGYVVGDQASYLRVMIRTGHIVAQIAESLGYVVESIDLFRTRFATATGEQMREEVVVLRWPV